MLQIGSLVDGKYKILNKVGQGGMSVVYLAMNEKANKQWAVKEVRKDGVLDFEAVKQGLVAETDILKRLDHPYLPSIIDVIDTDESFIIIMDYIQGNSLNKALDEFGAQPQDEVIKWAKQLCDVLGYLHTRTPPIIYRDMKPANVMLKPDGNISLIDFGTAREYKEKNLADTTCLGTVGYAAPEQFGGMGQTDARTDIYCLGATLYHLVTGKNPCEPPYEIRPIREINPNLSSGLERIILKCTQRDPNDRYQSAAELMYALEHYEEVDDSYRKKQKRKLALFLAPVVLALLFAGASVWGYLSAEKQRTADYDFILAEAANESDPTTALNRYYEAITTDPTRTDAYLGNDDFSGMIDYLTRDGELTVSESSWLSRLKAGLDQKGSSGYSSTVDVLAELRAADPSGYEQVCYEIGEAYLFYYSVPVEKDRYAAAATWFQYARERFPIADMYCQISACLQNIAKYEKSEQHAKLYEEYQSLWSQILKLKTDANDFDDDLKLRIWNEITNMIQNNAKAFCEVTPPEEILAAIDEISADSEKITNTFLEKSVSTLRENIAATTNKILSYAETAE
ncbi:MAG: serine/threonine protein kinase [Oscillospiraceae bacterium]|nr:serine/threonine protein kinase [Oscillospiraceae bacterium]MEE3459150.1 serine/threonine-protein kinase [Candidatus Faecousia sp.]